MDSLNKLFDMISSKNKQSATIDYLIVGLGNPGSKYENTRHNCGFLAMDALANKYDVKVNRAKWDGLIGEGEIKGKRCILCKPQTFMNRSGGCVSQIANFYKLPPENIIIMFDDISLDVGKMRIKRKGSSGGQNGVKDIIALLGTEEFPRVKMGIGAKPNKEYDLADWVLSKFTPDDMTKLSGVFDEAISAVELIVSGDIDIAMNKYN